MGPRFSTFSPNMTRSTGPLLACGLALLSAQANAQAGATPPAALQHDADQPVAPIEPQPRGVNPATADDICRTLEQAAAENGLPVEFGATLDELLERIKHQLTKLGPILELEVAREPQARTRGG